MNRPFLTARWHALLMLNYRVDHPRWRVWCASDATSEGDATRFYGPGLAELVSGRPYSAFVAEGSEVSVLPGREILGTD